MAGSSLTSHASPNVTSSPAHPLCTKRRMDSTKERRGPRLTAAFPSPPAQMYGTTEDMFSRPAPSLRSPGTWLAKACSIVGRKEEVFLLSGRGHSRVGRLRGSAEWIRLCVKWVGFSFPFSSCVAGFFHVSRGCPDVSSYALPALCAYYRK